MGTIRPASLRMAWGVAETGTTASKQAATAVGMRELRSSIEHPDGVW